MNVKTADFIKSVASLDQLPKDELPQIAFIGRSNVGKSSLLNALLGRKRLALTSSTPGKTRLINFFLVNRSFYFVDLPGYGFSKAPPFVVQAWKNLIEGYLCRARLRLVVLLIDCRRGLMDSDLQMIEWLQYHRKAFVVVMTKADKLSRQALQKQINSLQVISPPHVYPFSAPKGYGKEKLWKAILNYLDK